MGQDIKFSFNNCNFKYRVSGILIENGKVLTVQINNNGFYCLPGGHVEIMESSKDAILREFYEETQIETEIDRLLYVTENFFNGKLGSFHELGFYYLLKPKNRNNIKDYYIIEHDKNGDVKLDFKWIEIDKLNNFKPDFLKEYLKEYKTTNLKHIIIHDKK